MYYENSQTKSTAFIITLRVSSNIFINPEFWGVSCELIYIYTASPENREFSMLNWQTSMLLCTFPVLNVLFLKEVSEPEC